MAKEDIMDKMIGVFVGAVLAGALIPVALQLLAQGNLDGLDASTVVLYGLISLAIVIVVVVIFFKLVQRA